MHITVVMEWTKKCVALMDGGNEDDEKKEEIYFIASQKEVGGD